MKNTDIAKIRQKLKNINTITNTEPHVVSDKVIGELARQALALLPCQSCDGSGEIRKLRDSENAWYPCPDCKS